jgi:glycerol-3-phosphate dehydrogenase
VIFPDLDLQPHDIQAVFAGIRPVVNTGKANPSKESREHVVWEEDGLLTVSGGKLTTFRLMARDALKAIQGRLPAPAAGHAQAPVLVTPDEAEAWISAAGRLSPTSRLRLVGRYGENASQILRSNSVDDLQVIPDTPYLWGELRWSAQHESIVHLDDLLLRRLRLGLLLPEGGRELLPEIRRFLLQEAGWDETRWQQEETAYLEMWRKCYYPKTYIE